MDPAYLCNACLALFERSAGVKLQPFGPRPAPQTKCSCGALASHVVDLDAAEPCAVNPEAEAAIVSRVTGDLEARHRANHETESAQKTITAEELHTQLAAVLAAGHGKRPVFIMDVEAGMTHAEPIKECLAAEAYDGELVWIIPRR